MMASERTLWLSRRGDARQAGQDFVRLSVLFGARDSSLLTVSRSRSPSAQLPCDMLRSLQPFRTDWKMLASSVMRVVRLIPALPAGGAPGRGLSLVGEIDKAATR
jgi:hypothetical protein